MPIVGGRSKRPARKAIAVVTVLLAVVAASSPGCAEHTAVTDSGQAMPAPDAATRTPTVATPAPIAAPTPDIPAVSKLVNDAIAAHGLPGAVVVIGHDGQVVFHQAYGSRKLAGEPGLDGSPAPAEPMTEDTIFDMASLTKSVATATAVMQLYEQGKVAFDDPVQRYLPEFNTANDPQRANVTVRMLLTNTSGEGIDVNLQDPWGLEEADKAEGVRRALTTPLQSGPGQVFRYSDINFILLGARCLRQSRARQKTFTFSRTYLRHLAWKKPAISHPPKHVGHTRCVGLRSHGLPRPTGASRWSVRQGHGAPVSCRASRQRQETRKAEPIRARIPITTFCCAARCMTQRHAAWGEWPGTPVCSPRPTM